MTRFRTMGVQCDADWPTAPPQVHTKNRVVDARGGIFERGCHWWVAPPV